MTGKELWEKVQSSQPNVMWKNYDDQQGAVRICIDAIAAMQEREPQSRPAITGKQLRTAANAVLFFSEKDWNGTDQVSRDDWNREAAKLSGIPNAEQQPCFESQQRKAMPYCATCFVERGVTTPLLSNESKTRGTCYDCNERRMP